MEEKKKPWYKTWWAIVIFIFLGLGLIGGFLPNDSETSNSIKSEIICDKPYLLVGTSCCLDNNDNRVCDKDESSQAQNNSDSQQTKVCVQDWGCTSWSICSTSGQQTRNCTLVTNNCNEIPKDKPIESQSCPPATAVTIGEKNALSKAKSYLEYTAFSYNGLVKQLEYEKFTSQEAIYGVDNCGANWTEQAGIKAKSYLDSMPFSRDGLISQLEYEGFTKEQAEYGVKAVGY